jgi:hypothetical protein
MVIQSNSTLTETNAYTSMHDMLWLLLHVGLSFFGQRWSNFNKRWSNPPAASALTLPAAPQAVQRCAC